MRRRVGNHVRRLALAVLVAATPTAPGATPASAASLAVLPPSGTMTLQQGFDLAVAADPGGAAVTDVNGTLDGQDVAAPLGACLRPVDRLTGPVTGEVWICRGLSGGVLGAGDHVLGISLSLTDGRTLSDQVTWNVRP